MPRGKAATGKTTTLTKLTKARAPYGSKTGKARGGTAANMTGLNWKTLQPKIETALKQNNSQLMTKVEGIFTKALRTSGKTSAATS